MRWRVLLVAVGLAAAGCLSWPRFPDDVQVDLEADRTVCLTASATIRKSIKTGEDLAPEAALATTPAERQTDAILRGRAIGEALKRYCLRGEAGERRAFWAALEAAAAPHGVTIACHPKAW